MNMDAYVNYLIHLLKCAIQGETPLDFPKELDFPQFFDLVKLHKLENICYVMLKKTDMSDVREEYAKELERVYFKTLMIDGTQQHYLEQVEKQFEENAIDYLVLKGRELSELYPKSVVRQSSDFDIYIGAKKSPQAKKIMETLGFSVANYSEDENHDEYIINNWVLCELHRVLIQGDYPWKKGCNEIVNNLILKDGTNHCYKMSKEDFYVYSLAHLAKHMKFSGIGIRAFLDMEFIYRAYKDSFDYEYLSKKLEECKLSEFEKNTRLLCQYWFCDKKDVEPVIKTFASYVISSGWIGTTEQMVATEAAQKAGKTNSKIFAKIKKCIDIIMSPYETMVERYPVLQKHKWLTPFYRVRRGISAVIRKRDLIKSVTSTISDASIDDGKEILKFKESIGL